MLNSDELGEKGESRFKELCADAKLTCNKSDRDRTGWDFIVEFPFTENERLSLDSRVSPISCHIQVKTTKQSSNSIRLRLSSAERIAKELKPSFICVLVVDATLQFKDAYLIHVAEDRLACILKRLRQEEKQGTPQSKINKKSISLKPNAQERIQVSGNSLREAIESKVGKDMHSYIQSKKGQLEKLGFEGAPYEATVKIEITSTEELVDAFLGLKENIKLIDFAAFQNRFGIKLPSGEGGEGKLSIRPSPIDQCIISVRANSLSFSYTFKADMYTPGLPNLPLEHLKVLIKSKLFTIALRQNQYELNVEYGSKALPLEEWLDFWSMLKIFSSGEGRIHIEAINKGYTFDLPIQCSTAFLPEEQCEAYINLLNALLEIFKKAGIPRDESISSECLENNFNDIHILKLILDGHIPTITCGVEDISSWVASETEPFIYARIYNFDACHIALYGLATFKLKNEGKEKVLFSDDFSLKRIQFLRNENEFKKFTQAAIKSEGIDNILEYYR